MELMPEDAKAVLLYLGHRYSFEVGQAMDALRASGGPDVLSVSTPVAQ